MPATSSPVDAGERFGSIGAMNVAEGGRKVLESVLVKLGFEAEVEIEQRDDEVCLQIQSVDSRYLIGRGGDRLDDLQFLVNRIVQKKVPDAPRLRVDCDHYRENQESRLIDSVRPIAEQALADGEKHRTKPLNAYHRRIVHNVLKEMGLQTDSEAAGGRYKKIVLWKAD